jgi:hypothetical protein
MSQDNSTPLPAVNGIIMPATCYRFIAEQIGTTKYTKTLMDAANWMTAVCNWCQNPAIMRHQSEWLPFTHEEWGELLGLSRDQTDRALRLLKRGGLFDVRHGHGSPLWVRIAAGVIEALSAMPTPEPLVRRMRRVAGDKAFAAECATGTDKLSVLFRLVSAGQVAS